MNEKKRMARDYEITQSIRIGEKEIVLGVDENSEHPYFCAYYESNDIIGRYYDCLMSADYAEIIFFDWDDENGQDGESDHTGIVERVENGRVYTVEGNSGDSCRQNSYPIGYYEVLGYGCPAY